MKICKTSVLTEIFTVWANRYIIAIYISKTYSTSSHLCLCGCGQLTTLPLNTVFGWELIEKEGIISFTPSVGNSKFPCHSHYWIRDNQGFIDSM